MIWILLAALGVPLWLIVGVLAAGLLSRKAFKKAPGVFPAKLRLSAGVASGIKSSWPRLPAYARWVHDVLLVHHGLALVRNSALPVAEVSGRIVSGKPEEVKRLGPQPMLLSVVLDNGATVDVAAPAEARDVMVGPFTGVLV